MVNIGKSFDTGIDSKSPDTGIDSVRNIAAAAVLGIATLTTGCAGPETENDNHTFVQQRVELEKERKIKQENFEQSREYKAVADFNKEFSNVINGKEIFSLKEIGNTSEGMEDLYGVFLDNKLIVREFMTGVDYDSISYPSAYASINKDGSYSASLGSKLIDADTLKDKEFVQNQVDKFLQSTKEQLKNKKYTLRGPLETWEQAGFSSREDQENYYLEQQGVDLAEF